MAASRIARTLISSRSKSHYPLYNRLSISVSRFYFQSPPSPKSTSFTPLPTLSGRLFCSGAETVDTTTTTAAPTKRNPKLVNFSLSDSDSDSDEKGSNQTAVAAPKEIDKSKLPPPYNPFSKKPVIEEPEDPSNLQEVFHKIRTEGLFNNAVKMFDGLSKDGLTHEALELFSQIKDKGHMPDVVAHTAVIEAYADAGQAKEAHKVYLRMLASGVLPNAYTYSVLIKGLAKSGDGKMLGEVKKYVMEMAGKGMKPNAGTYVAVFEAFVRLEKGEEGREFLAEMKLRGFVVEEKAVREVLKDKRGPGFRGVMDILFGK